MLFFSFKIDKKKRQTHVFSSRYCKSFGEHIAPCSTFSCHYVSVIIAANYCMIMCVLKKSLNGFFVNSGTISGSARSRMLNTLFKDPRAAQLPAFPLLEKLYLDRLIKANEVRSGNDG